MKRLLVALLIMFGISGTTMAQHSEFNYVGFNAGVAGGELIDSITEPLNGPFFGNTISTETYPKAFGLQGFRMIKPNEEGIAFGFSLAFSRFSIDSRYAGEDFTSDYNGYAAGLLIGDIIESDSGGKSTYFFGAEYHTISVSLDSSVPQVRPLLDWYNSIFDEVKGFAVPFGFYSTLGQETGLTAGLRGRYFPTEPSYYEIFLSLGFSF